MPPTSEPDAGDCIPRDDPLAVEVVTAVQGAQEITEALVAMARTRERAVAEDLLALGADINWIGWDDLTPLDAARRSGGADLAEWLIEHGALSAEDWSYSVDRQVRAVRAAAGAGRGPARRPATSGTRTNS